MPDPPHAIVIPQAIRDRAEALRHAGQFAAAVVQHAAAGFPTLPAEATAARLVICGVCEQYEAPNRCRVCGCNLAVKASWADQDCPIGKWPV